MKKKIVVIALLGLCIALLVYPSIVFIRDAVYYGQSFAKALDTTQGSDSNYYQALWSAYGNIFIQDIICSVLLLAAVIILIVFIILILRKDIAALTRSTVGEKVAEIKDKRTARAAEAKAKKIEQLNKQLDELREKDSD